MNRSVIGFLVISFSIAGSIYAPQSPPQAPPTSPVASVPPRAEKMDEVNADVVAARAATKEKRYGDAEALMLKTTSSRPDLVIPWMELGIAQLDLKKYADAETSFKMALGIDPKSQQFAATDDFFQSSNTPSPRAAHPRHA